MRSRELRFILKDLRIKISLSHVFPPVVNFCDPPPSEIYHKTKLFFSTEATKKRGNLSFWSLPAFSILFSIRVNEISKKSH
jgi:hypothetical protein